MSKQRWEENPETRLGASTLYAENGKNETEKQAMSDSFVEDDDDDWNDQQSSNNESSVEEESEEEETFSFEEQSIEEVHNQEQCHEEKSWHEAEEEKYGNFARSHDYEQDESYQETSNEDSDGESFGLEMCSEEEEQFSKDSLARNVYSSNVVKVAASPGRARSRKKKKSASRKSKGKSKIDFNKVGGSDGYDAEHIDQILKSAHRGKEIYGGRWNILLAGDVFTNAGQAGHANLPTVESGNVGELKVPPMYVKDILESQEKQHSLKASYQQMAVKFRWTSVSLKARKFYTAEVDLSSLFAGYRAVQSNKRFFVHKNCGNIDASYALQKTVNTGETFELVLSKSLTKELVDFIRKLNRTRGYGCCEFASIGSGWFAVQNLELLGHENVGFAGAKTKSKSLLGKVRYRREYEQSRAIGTVRTNSMFEEYSSPNGPFSSFDVDGGKAGAFTIKTGGQIKRKTINDSKHCVNRRVVREPDIDLRKPVIEAGGRVKRKTINNPEHDVKNRVIREPSIDLRKPFPVVSTHPVDDISALDQSTDVVLVSTRIVRNSDGSVENTQEFSDGSKVITVTHGGDSVASRDYIRNERVRSSGGGGAASSHSNRGNREGNVRGRPKAVKSDATTLTTITTGNSNPERRRSSNTSIEYEPKTPKADCIFEEVEPGLVSISCNGRDGQNGKSGNHGADGKTAGADGEAGINGSEATDGGDALSMNIFLRSIPNEGSGGIRVVFVDPVSGREKEEAEKVFSLSSFPKLKWSATGGSGGHGGSGGNGGNGCKGLSTSDHHVVQTGGNGGSGGSGGHGMKGGNGGRGGDVKIHIKKCDVFLLAVMDCDAPDLVAGGAAGSKGKHGRGGKGASGGIGGDGKVRRQGWVIGVNSAADGATGSNGRSPTHSLNDGETGPSGSFEVVVEDFDNIPRSYPGVFDIRIRDICVHGECTIIGSGFEFGSLIHFESAEVENIGQMAFPACNHVLLQMTTPGHAILKVTPEQNGTVGELTIGSKNIGHGEHGISSGRLGFTSSNPRCLHENDTEPIRIQIPFAISTALKGGPGISCSLPLTSLLSRHERSVCFGYPIENRGGFHGITSLTKGEPATVDFEILNTSNRAMGTKSSEGRPVFLRFYLADTDEHIGRHLGFSIIDKTKQCPCDENVEGALAGKGYTYAVEEILPGASQTITARLVLDNTISSYQKINLQVEIRLGIKDSSENLIIQRRRHVLTCEPTENTFFSSDVVLVTSEAISQEQYQTWIRLLRNKLGLSPQIFSVSRYGSLDPNFSLEDGTRLSDAFLGKLVIVLNEPLSGTLWDGMSPLDLIPPNSIGRSSTGYHETTRWLIVSAGGDHHTIASKLLCSYGNLAENSSSIRTQFPNVALYRQEVQRMVDQEASRGSIMTPSDKIIYEVPTSETSVAKEAEWLQKVDGLRQYTIVYSAQKMDIIIEFCRSRNPGAVVNADDFSTKSVFSREMMLGVAKAMSCNQRAMSLVKALQLNHDEDWLQALQIAATSELLAEVRYVLDGNLALDDDVDDCFPTLRSLTDNIDVLVLLRDSLTDEALATRMTKSLSTLVGRLSAVAESKDLRPRVKVIKANSTQQALTSAVKRIRRQWRQVMQQSLIDSTKKDIKEQVYALLGIDRTPNSGRKVGARTKGQGGNVRADWMTGLSFLHSCHNTTLYDGVVSERIIDLDQGLHRKAFQERASPAVHVFDKSTRVQMSTDKIFEVSMKLHQLRNGFTRTGTEEDDQKNEKEMNLNADGVRVGDRGENDTDDDSVSV